MNKLKLAIATFLVFSILYLSFLRIEVVNAQSTIYIRSDGSIEGTNKIQKDGNSYTFTNSIFGSVIVDKDNIVLDGAGFTLEYSRGSYGLTVNGKTVTIKGITVSQTENDSTLGVGIHINQTSYCTITNSTITGNNVGISISQSTRIRISNNIVKKNSFTGISISSSDNTIIGNQISDNNYGVYFHNPGNTVTENQIENNVVGIYCLELDTVEPEIKNLIYDNNFNNNTYHFINWAMMALPMKNVFEKDALGNFWSNYNGTDNNNDGIGDTPFIIDENNQDNYPLMNPVDIEIIPEFPSWTILPFILTISLLSLVVSRKLKSLTKSSNKLNVNDPFASNLGYYFLFLVWDKVF